MLERTPRKNKESRKASTKTTGYIKMTNLDRVNIGCHILLVLVKVMAFLAAACVKLSPISSTAHSKRFQWKSIFRKYSWLVGVHSSVNKLQYGTSTWSKFESANQIISCSSHILYRCHPKVQETERKGRVIPNKTTSFPVMILRTWTFPDFRDLH